MSQVTQVYRIPITQRESQHAEMIMPDGLQRWLHEQEQLVISQGQPSPAPKKVIKILLSGNSGAGKSLIGNVLFGREVFQHQSQSTSVTDTLCVGCTVLEETAQPCIVCDMPGLLEANSKNLERNRHAFQQAVCSVLPACETVIVFVLQNPNGRMMYENMQALKDVETFTNSCGDGQSRPSLCCIVNNVDKDELDDQWEVHCSVVTQQIRDFLQRPNTVVEFVPRIPRHERLDLKSSVMKDLQKQLVSVVAQKLISVRINPTDGTLLSFHFSNEALIAQFELLTSELAKLKLENEDAKFSERDVHRHQLELLLFNKHLEQIHDVIDKIYPLAVNAGVVVEENDNSSSSSSRNHKTITARYKYILEKLHQPQVQIAICAPDDDNGGASVSNVLNAMLPMHLFPTVNDEDVKSLAGAVIIRHNKDPKSQPTLQQNGRPNVVGSESIRVALERHIAEMNSSSSNHDYDVCLDDDAPRSTTTEDHPKWVLDVHIPLLTSSDYGEIQLHLACDTEALMEADVILCCVSKRIHFVRETMETLMLRMFSMRRDLIEDGRFCFCLLGDEALADDKEQRTEGNTESDDGTAHVTTSAFEQPRTNNNSIETHIRCIISLTLDQWLSLADVSHDDVMTTVERSDTVSLEQALSSTLEKALAHVYAAVYHDVNRLLDDVKSSVQMVCYRRQQTVGDTNDETTPAGKLDALRLLIIEMLRGLRFNHNVILATLESELQRLLVEPDSFEKAISDAPTASSLPSTESLSMGRHRVDDYLKKRELRLQIQFADMLEKVFREFLLRGKRRCVEIMGTNATSNPNFHHITAAAVNLLNRHVRADVQLRMFDTSIDDKNRRRALELASCHGAVWSPFYTVHLPDETIVDIAAPASELTVKAYYYMRANALVNHIRICANAAQAVIEEQLNELVSRPVEVLLELVLKNTDAMPDAVMSIDSNETIKELDRFGDDIEVKRHELLGECKPSSEPSTRAGTPLPAFHDAPGPLHGPRDILPGDESIQSFTIVEYRYNGAVPPKHLEYILLGNELQEEDKAMMVIVLSDDHSIPEHPYTHPLYKTCRSITNAVQVFCRIDEAEVDDEHDHVLQSPNLVIAHVTVGVPVDPYNRRTFVCAAANVKPDCFCNDANRQGCDDCNTSRELFDFCQKCRGLLFVGTGRGPQAFPMLRLNRITRGTAEATEVAVYASSDMHVEATFQQDLIGRHSVRKSTFNVAFWW